MSPVIVSADAFNTHIDLGDWRYIFRRIKATFHAGSFAGATRLVEAIGVAAEAAGHHPDLDIRYPGRIFVTLTTHALGGEISELDVALAAEISQLARRLGASAEPPSALQSVEVALDAFDITAIVPFWKAVLGYVDDGTPNANREMTIMDPARIGPSFWFQQMDEPRPIRSRFHLDIGVPHDAAEARVAAALAAGGTLLTDQFARAWWVLADAEGNEACICTWQDRD